MANIVIKKTIKLDFIAPDYADDYLVFKSMSLREYEELLPKLDKVKANNVESTKAIKQILTDLFLEGKFGGEDVTKENLEDFDIETIIHIFEILTGQVPPKVGS